MDGRIVELEKLLSISDNQSNSNKELIFKQFLGKVNEKVSTSEFLEKLFSCSGNADRVDVVKEHFQWIPLDPEIKKKYRKHNGISLEFRNLGNSVFQKSCYVVAVRLYNLAVLFAVPGDPELALAYANRSAALHSMGLVEEAISDIDLALASNYPNDSIKRKKLDDRKKRYQAHLVDQLKDASFEIKLKEEVTKRNSFYKDLFTLKSANPMAPALEDSVDIKYNPVRGRHLVANRDIPIGDTILVETPVVVSLDKALNWEVDHCHHCLKKNFRCIPCPNCVFTLYCNEKCRAEAEVKYHRYECPCLPELHCNMKDDLAKNFHLIFKLICLVGPSKLLAMFIEQEENKHEAASQENNNMISGSNIATGIYEPDSYEAIYNLMSTNNPREGYYFVLLSLILSYTLDSNSDFFDSNTADVLPRCRSELRDFTAGVILRHFEAFRKNVYGLGEISEMEGVTLRSVMHRGSQGTMMDYDFEGFGSGAFATASLLNHSCDQNVIRFTGKRFGTTAMVALKPLKKGEELLISYGPLYGSLRWQDGSAQLRQTVLNTGYQFTCDCIACKHDWPGIMNLSRRQPTFVCSLCAAKHPHERKMSPEFLKCKLSGTFECRSCNRHHVKQSIVRENERRVKALEVCQKLVLSNAPLEAISALKSALQFFETNVCPPNCHCLLGPKLFREAVHLIIFFSDCDG